MDPLSDVLSLVKPRNLMSAGIDAGGEWSIRFPDQQGTIKCGVVVSGRCWLSMEGVPEPVLLESGDGFLLPHGRTFRIAGDPAFTPVDVSEVIRAPSNGRIVKVGTGGDCLLVSSRFAPEGRPAGGLLRVLPPVVHIRGAQAQATMQWSVERMMQELREPRPGSALVLQHLAHMTLVEALRLHLADAAGVGVGWLFALADKRLAAAIAALHDMPARPWTLAALAALAGMSRSSFALAFKQRVGTSPMEYLTRWRMLLAADRFAGGEPVSVVALSLGYESESAFSTAFKRVMGSSPRHYVRDGSSLAAA